MYDKLIREHPRDIGETYCEHATHALFIGTRLIMAGLACLVHALLPGLFVKTASNIMANINRLMEKRTAAAPSLGISPATMMENPSN